MLLIWQSNTKSSILLIRIIFIHISWARSSVGRALPLQGRGPGFKSRWVHLILFWILIKYWYFYFLCSTFSVVEFVWRNDLFVDCSCISNPTGTNKPNFSCLLCKIVGKTVFVFSQTYFMFDTGIFSFVVFTIYLTRLISLSIIFFVKILLLVLSGG